MSDILTRSYIEHLELQKETRAQIIKAFDMPDNATDQMIYDQVTERIITGAINVSFK